MCFLTATDRTADNDISFAFVRMVSYGYEGGYTVDGMFDQNMRGAKANGIQAAPYVYLQTRTVEEARPAAKFPYNLWMARYGTEHTYPNRIIWQATDQGTVNGIDGNVCIEFAFKDYGAARGEWRGRNRTWN